MELDLREVLMLTKHSLMPHRFYRDHPSLNNYSCATRSPITTANMASATKTQSQKLFEKLKSKNANKVSI